MPTYDYECKECGVFEKFQKMTEDPIKECPDCEGEVTRLIGSGMGFIFKGSGFYETDYRSSSYNEQASKEKSSDSSNSSDCSGNPSSCQEPTCGSGES